MAYWRIRKSIKNSALAGATTGNTYFEDYDSVTKTSYYVDYSIIKTTEAIESV